MSFLGANYSANVIIGLNDKIASDFTIQITPIYDDNGDGYDNTNIRILKTSRIKNNKFRVVGDIGPFYWHVIGKRLDINIEPLKTDVILNGSGPYKWIE